MELYNIYTFVHNGILGSPCDCTFQQIGWLTDFIDSISILCEMCLLIHLLMVIWIVPGWG